jgi:hypothetical protein
LALNLSDFYRPYSYKGKSTAHDVRRFTAVDFTEVSYSPDGQISGEVQQKIVL